MGSYFSREKNESQLYKKAEVGNKYFKYLTFGFALISSIFLTVISAGTILLIDGGITISILIFNLSLSIYEKLSEKYLSYLSSLKKREFQNSLITFYEGILSPSVNKIKCLIEEFIIKENIIKKTDEKFEKKKKYFINDREKLKDKYNILVIGPAGSGKSTLINEFLELKEKKAKEGIGDSITMEFTEYKTDKSKYCLTDSMGIDYSKPISEFSQILQNRIKKSNLNPYTFIDMIYYCTNNVNRFQTEEFKMISELKKLFNIGRTPVIIVMTQCYFEEDFINLKNFISTRYKEENFSILRVVARQKGSIQASGLKELKDETEKRLKNFHENAYASKFIGDISQKLYKEYSNSYFKSFIKGIFSPDKEQSFEFLFTRIFNMYRFENKDLSDSDLKKIKTIYNEFMNSFKNNLEEITFKIIDLHAESCTKKDNNIAKELELSHELQEKKEKLKSTLINKEFERFKEDIDKIVFPCCLDVFKIEIMKSFNLKVFEHLKPKIELLMAQTLN